MTSAPEPIDAYLDQLLFELRGRSRDVRRILAETEDHLHEASEAAQADGLSEMEAQRTAVSRFGAPRKVARRFVSSGPVSWRPSSDTLLALVHAAAYLAAIGLLAIGASGLLSEAFGRAFGADMVAGDLPGVSYTADRCTELKEYAPKGYDCMEAAAYHHWGETVVYRGAAGVLGLLLGGALLLWRRRRAEVPDAAVLPDGFVPTIGASLFGVAAAGLLLESLNAFIAGKGTGSGQFLSAGLVAAAVFGVFAYRLLGTLTTRATTVATASSDDDLPRPG
jgi:hypothetical protein